MSSSSSFGKWLELILKMSDGHNYTAPELAAVLGTSTRNFYYTLGVLREEGFTVCHEGRYYYLDPHSPFFSHIASAVDFTETEAVYLHSLLENVQKDNTNALAAMLKRKLERYYGLTQYTDVKLQRHIYNNVSQLEQAIHRKRVAILHGYASPHSQSVTDRVVEPFAFLGDKQDVRAFEMKSGVNKTFKIARIDHVEVVDAPWFNEERHKRVFTDMFMFSGEVTHKVTLRFDLLSRSLMLEEYPHSAPMMTADGAGHWLFTTDLVSYVGISRFILGLYDHITVLADEGLKRYLKERIERM